MKGDWASLPFCPDDQGFDLRLIEQESGASHVSDSERMHFLVRPTSLHPLQRRADGTPEIRLHHDRPLLLPDELAARVAGDELRITLADAADPLLQYAYLGVVKNSGGEHNAAADDPWYRKHLHRSRVMLRDAAGIVLDVGCDDPRVSRALFPPRVRYLGLDPALGPRSEYCLVAMAEFLPIAPESVDGVSFLTSLDHILDYHAALDEAFRVLRPGGNLYLATLIWTRDAELTRDTIHFHHFRQHEIEGALDRFQITNIRRYDWKGDHHRFGVYLVAQKAKAAMSFR